MDTHHQQPTKEPSTSRPERDAQSLLIITHLAAQPTRKAFFAAWHRLLDIYVATGMEVGWSREAAEEVADEDMARASAVLGSLNPHFVNEPGHA